MTAHSEDYVDGTCQIEAHDCGPADAANASERPTDQLKRRIFTN